MAKMTDDEYEDAYDVIVKFMEEAKELRLRLIDNNEKLTKEQIDYIYDHLHDNFRLW